MATMLRSALSLVLAAAAAALASVDIRLQEDSLLKAIDKVTEKLRYVILNGDPKKGKPRLDPFTIDKLDFSLNEPPTVQLEGTLRDARVAGAGAFALEKCSVKMGALPPSVAATLAVRVPRITAEGQYSLRGAARVHPALDALLAPDGHFKVVVGDINFGVKVVVNLPKKVETVELTLGLFDLDVEISSAEGQEDAFLSSEVATRALEWWGDNRQRLQEEGGAALQELLQEVLDGALSAPKATKQ